MATTMKTLRSPLSGCEQLRPFDEEQAGQIMVAALTAFRPTQQVWFLPYVKRTMIGSMVQASRSGGCLMEGNVLPVRREEFILSCLEPWAGRDLVLSKAHD